MAPKGQPHEERATHVQQLEFMSMKEYTTYSQQKWGTTKARAEEVWKSLLHDPSTYKSENEEGEMCVAILMNSF